MKISVITVTYNCASVVENCLTSIAEQSYTDVEHIVVDGASTDGTLDILNIYRSNFAVLLSEPDTGIYDAMNKGLALASGDIVGFLNADDFYAHDRALENVVRCFTDNQLLDACYSDLMYVDKSDTSRTVRYWQSNSFVTASFSRGWCPPHPTFFVRRYVYERFGNFDLTYRIAADIELMTRFLEVRKLNVKYIPEVWVKMRIGGTTNKNWLNIWVQNREVLRALKYHGLSANPLRFFVHKIWSRGLQFLRRPTV
ncbi:glycosyltransferase family 2 protein [Alphaproteobacteria bacterium LSUCC0744]